MFKSLVFAAAALFATSASAAVIVVPVGVIVVPPTQTTSPGVTFVTAGASSGYYEFFISQPDTIGVSSFTNSAVGSTGIFNFDALKLYSGMGVGGSLLETGAITQRLGGTETAYLDDYTFGIGLYTIAYTGTTSGVPASVGSSITIAAGTVAAVPELSTWLLMIAGFGMIGFAARARRRNVRVTYA